MLEEAFAILKADSACIPIHPLQIPWGPCEGGEVVQLADLGYPPARFRVPE